MLIHPIINSETNLFSLSEFSSNPGTEIVAPAALVFYRNARELLSLLLSKEFEAETSIYLQSEHCDNLHVQSRRALTAILTERECRMTFEQVSRFLKNRREQIRQILGPHLIAQPRRSGRQTGETIARMQRDKMEQQIRSGIEEGVKVVIHFLNRSSLVDVICIA